MIHQVSFFEKTGETFILKNFLDNTFKKWSSLAFNGMGPFSAANGE